MRASGCSLGRKVRVVHVDLKGRNNWMGAGNLDKGTEGYRGGVRVAVDAGGQPTHHLLYVVPWLFPQPSPLLLPVAGSTPGPASPFWV